MRRRPPRSTRTDTLFPDTTLFRSVVKLERGGRGRILNGTLAIPPPPVAKIAFAGVRKRRDMLAMQAVEAAPHMPPLRPRQEAAPALFRAAVHGLAAERHAQVPIGEGEAILPAADAPIPVAAQALDGRRLPGLGGDPTIGRGAG